MKLHFHKLTMMLALLFAGATQANAQYCPDGQCNLNRPNTPQVGWSNQSTWSDQGSWQDRSTSAASNDFPALTGYPFGSQAETSQWNNVPQPRRSDYPMDMGRNDLNWRTPADFPSRQIRSRQNGASSLPDPFRLPALQDRNSGRGIDFPRDRRSRPQTQTRYRIPYDQGFDERALPAGPMDDVSDRDFREQYVPVPLPGRADDDEVREIFDGITARYQDPTLIRSLRSMSASQSQSLYREVSQKIDERALEPSSYDVRTRRALRNLSLALDNPAFRQSLGLQSNSFQLDGFRDLLSRVGSNARISNYQDAVAVMQSVMREAAAIPGLSESVVAYEFANAQVDTLDRFSALEPLDPVANRGASKAQPTQSAALEDEIFGIGVEVKEHEQGLIVVKPLRNSPAAEAGLEPGDVILSINGQPIQGMPMTRSVDLLKTTSGRQLTLRILRSGRGERDFALTPRRIRIYSVDATRIIPGTQTGYLSLSRFSQNSTSELDAALNQLHTQGMKSLIIDLRGNPGGLLTTCVEISDRFLPCGTIVTTRGRLSVDNMQETATYSRTWSVPLVVLIDGDSASASEIFAAAVQENRRGVVLGTKSYGKGSVQTHFPMNSASANLRLTTALFYSPNGRRMAGEGVTPDVTIEDEDGVANGDKVLIEAARIAQSQQLQDLAKAAGSCRPGQSTPAARSSSLNDISDSINHMTALR